MEKGGYHEDEEAEVVAGAERGRKLLPRADVFLSVDVFNAANEVVFRDKNEKILFIIGKNQESNSRGGEIKSSYTLYTASGHRILIPVPGMLSASGVMEISSDDESSMDADLVNTIRGLFSQDFTIYVENYGIKLENNSDHDEYYLVGQFPLEGMVDSLSSIGAEQVGVGRDGFIEGMINGGKKFYAATFRELGKSKYPSRNEDNVGGNLDKGCLVVADGVGAHGYGEFASHIAVESVVNSESANLSGMLQDAHNNLAVLTRAISPGISPPDTGIAVVQLKDDKCYVTYRGDCRVLHIRGGKCINMTIPRNVAWERYLCGVGSYMNTFVSKERCCVTTSVLIKDSIEHDFLPSYLEWDLIAGDTVVVFDDGLPFSEDEISKIVEGRDPQQVVEFLLEETRRRNEDNQFPIVIDSDHSLPLGDDPDNIIGKVITPDEIRQFGVNPVIKSSKDNASVIVYEHT